MHKNVHRNFSNCSRSTIHFSSAHGYCQYVLYKSYFKHLLSPKHTLFLLVTCAASCSYFQLAADYFSTLWRSCEGHKILGGPSTTGASLILTASSRVYVQMVFAQRAGVMCILQPTYHERDQTETADQPEKHTHARMRARTHTHTHAETVYIV